MKIHAVYAVRYINVDGKEQQLGTYEAHSEADACRQARLACRLPTTERMRARIVRALPQ